MIWLLLATGVGWLLAFNWLLYEMVEEWNASHPSSHYDFLQMRSRAFQFLREYEKEYPQSGKTKLCKILAIAFASGIVGAAIAAAWPLFFQ